MRVSLFLSKKRKKMSSKTENIIDKFAEWGTSDDFNHKLDIWMEVRYDCVIVLLSRRFNIHLNNREIAKVSEMPKYRENKNSSGEKSLVNIMIG